MFTPGDSVTPPRQYRVKNTHGTACPPFGVGKVVGIENGVVQITRPDADDVDPRLLVAVGPWGAKAGKRGQATPDWPWWAAGDGEEGDEVGTTAGSWELAFGRAGFVVWQGGPGGGGSGSYLAPGGPIFVNAGGGTGGGGDTAGDYAILLAGPADPPFTNLFVDGSTVGDGFDCDPDDATATLAGCPRGCAWAPLWDDGCGKLVYQTTGGGQIVGGGTQCYRPAYPSSGVFPSIPTDGLVVRLRRASRFSSFPTGLFGPVAGPDMPEHYLFDYPAPETEYLHVAGVLTTVAGIVYYSAARAGWSVGAGAFVDRAGPAVAVFQKNQATPPTYCLAKSMGVILGSGEAVFCTSERRFVVDVVCDGTTLSQTKGD